MNKRIKEIALQNSIEVTWQEACYFGFFILLSVTKGLGLYEGQKLFELLVIPAFFWEPSSWRSRLIREDSG